MITSRSNDDAWCGKPPGFATDEVEASTGGGWPTWQWWGYLLTTMPDPGTQALVNQWLMIGAEIIFGTDDPTLCKEASERAGYDTVSRFCQVSGQAVQ
jgi:hypothetical protein